MIKKSKNKKVEKIELRKKIELIQTQFLRFLYGDHNSNYTVLFQKVNKSTIDQYKSNNCKL